MEIFAWIALIILALVGYSAYRSYQDRALAKRLEQMRDKESILGEIDAATRQVQSEAEYWRRNRRL